MTNNQRLYWLLTRIGRGDEVENIAGYLSQADQLAVIRCAEDDRLLDPAVIADPASTFKKIAANLGDTVVLCKDEVVAHVDDAATCLGCFAHFSDETMLTPAEGLCR